ncbi:homoserine kinase [Nostocoides japonicum]|nr:homoserine kinase [Tetrasphaera japonica]
MPSGMPSPVPVGATVTVRVPASSANLGPGFDSVGLALGVWDECRVTVVEAPGVAITVSGEGEGSVPLDASHLVHRTMVTAWRELGVEPPVGLRLDCVNEVPHGRGMGSSATAIVTGVVAAQALHTQTSGPSGRAGTAGDAPTSGRAGTAGDAPTSGADLDLDWAGDLASRLEGHPDNASASVYGGLTLSWSDEPGVAGSTRTVRLRPDPRVEVVVFVPVEQLSTARARSVLPVQVRLGDAAANSARAALLVHAATSDPSLLLPATREWLHQDARRPSYAASMALVDRLRAAGHAAVISGAGPSVLVLGTRESASAAADLAPRGWRVLRPGIPLRGAHLVEASRPVGG